MDIDFNKYPLPQRLRHHTAPNLYFKHDDLKYDPHYYPPLIKQLDWSELFQNGGAPKMLDIGCGKGGFLLDYAERFPERNALGIELRPEPVRWIERFCEGEKVPNCNAIWYSVVNGLGFIESNSVDEIFYLFPDPWTKRKFMKRRAFNAEVLTEMHRVLVPNGRLFLATDVFAVDDDQLKLLKSKSALFDYKYVESDEEWDRPVTNKERFCRLESIPFRRMICSKK
jgi:tRNA (guanine-N7-)-methyltransferase